MADSASYQTLQRKGDYNVLLSERYGVFTEHV